MCVVDQGFATPIQTAVSVIDPSMSVWELVSYSFVYDEAVLPVAVLSFSSEASWLPNYDLDAIWRFKKRTTSLTTGAASSVKTEFHLGNNLRVLQ
jgi:hypothetical protein